jgi:hypothetical protein
VLRKGRKIDEKVLSRAKKVTDYVRNIVLYAIRILFIGFMAKNLVSRSNSYPISLGKGRKEVMTRTVSRKQILVSTFLIGSRLSTFYVGTAFEHVFGRLPL